VSDARAFAPITIEIAPKRFQTVNSVAEAAEMLLFRWPDERRGPAYRMALRSCLAALEGNETTATARNTFLHAEEEAGIFVREG
jgi:hypothetical protein